MDMKNKILIISQKELEYVLPGKKTTGLERNAVIIDRLLKLSRISAGYF